MELQSQNDSRPVRRANKRMEKKILNSMERRDARKERGKELLERQRKNESNSLRIVVWGDRPRSVFKRSDWK